MRGRRLSATREVWATFKTLNPGVKLADCKTRDVGYALAKHYKDKDLKSASVKKIVGRLGAAVNLAIKDGKLPPFNPFHGVAVLDPSDKTERKPFTDADVALIWENIDKCDDGERVLRADDALVIRVMAATGVRLHEVHEIGATVTRKIKDKKTKQVRTVTEINGDKIEEGVRFVTVGTKTETSRRNVPLPAALLPYLPPRITAPLVTGDSNAQSVRLNDWLDSIGIDDPAKVASHSWRHKMQDRLRATGCAEEYRHALLGHEKKTVAKGYGEGYPMTMLKAFLDKASPLPKLRAVA